MAASCGTGPASVGGAVDEEQAAIDDTPISDISKKIEALLLCEKQVRSSKNALDFDIIEPMLTQAKTAVLEPVQGQI